MRILYVNHTGQVSGAERSLLDLLGGLGDGIEARLACPTDGPLAAMALSKGVHATRIAGCNASLRLNPTRTARAVGSLGYAAAQIARHAKRFDADVIHANSIRAGLMCVGAGKLCRAEVLVHLRDRLPRTRVADATMRLIAREATTIVANSRYSAEGLTDIAAPAAEVIVVPNPVDLTRFDPSKVEKDAARSALGLPPRAVALGVVGQITPWKGQAEAVQALASLTKRRPDLHLFIVGEAKFVSSTTRYDNRAYLAQMEHFILENGLADRVHLLGEREDVPALMRALDILLVPSWDEPFGRVVVEGMAMGLAIIATSIGGPAEILDDGVDGLLVPPRDPGAWANAIDRLSLDPPRLRQLGELARQRSTSFDVPHHVQAMAAAYEATTTRTEVAQLKRA